MTDEEYDSLVDELAKIFMPTQVMSLRESEAFGPMVYEAVRGYCFTKQPQWTDAQKRAFADAVRKRIEWRLHAKRSQPNEAKGGEG